PPPASPPGPSLPRPPRGRSAQSVDSGSRSGANTPRTELPPPLSEERPQRPLRYGPFRESAPRSECVLQGSQNFGSSHSSRSVPTSISGRGNRSCFRQKHLPVSRHRPEGKIPGTAIPTRLLRPVAQGHCHGVFTFPQIHPDRSALD